MELGNAVHRKVQCVMLAVWAQGKQSQSSLQYDRLQALDSPALRAGNWGQLCVTCKVSR